MLGVKKLMEALYVLNFTPNVSIQRVAKQYNLSVPTMRFRRKKIQAGEPNLKKVGRKCAFDAETEEHTAKCINVLCNYGFSPLMIEIQVKIPCINNPNNPTFYIISTI